MARGKEKEGVGCMDKKGKKKGMGSARKFVNNGYFLTLSFSFSALFLAPFKFSHSELNVSLSPLLFPLSFVEITRIGKENE